MKKNATILILILGATIFLTVFTMNVTAEQGAFQTSKTDRSLIKDLVVGQKEIKSTIKQLESKIGRLGVCQ
jgi:peptidoglycan hydrolase CwlO-like protein